MRPSHPEIKWEPIGELEFHDVGLDAPQAKREDNLSGVFSNDDYSNLFSKATKIVHLTHKVGTELHGVNLADLTDVEKRELALLIARRVVVFFKKQTDLTIEKQLELESFMVLYTVMPPLGCLKALTSTTRTQSIWTRCT